MRNTLLLLVLLGLLAPTTSLRCETCTYAYVAEKGRVYNCVNEAANGRLCPPDFLCYSMKYSYSKTGINEKLGIRDPPQGDYMWIFQGCVYKTRDVDDYICRRKLKQFKKLVATEAHACEVEACDGDKCNKGLTDNFLANA